MLETKTANRLGYGLLTVGVVVGLYAGYKNDQGLKEVNNKQTTFIVSQCKRDKVRDDSVIQALEDAKVRVRIQFATSNPDALATSLAKIQHSINTLKHKEKCEVPE